MKRMVRMMSILAATAFGMSIFLVPSSAPGQEETLVRLPVQSSATDWEAPLESQQQADVSLTTTTTLTVAPRPVTLSIPSINVVAPVASVGIFGKAMAVPANSTDVGWYEFGVPPGMVGSAVLAGHVNWYGGKDAVFTNLHDIVVGDRIEVTDSSGTQHVFVVRELKQYAINADTSEVFISNDGLSHLNLITCDGAWSTLMGTHEKRLVVFADKVQDVQLPPVYGPYQPLAYTNDNEQGN